MPKAVKSQEFLNLKNNKLYKLACETLEREYSGDIKHHIYSKELDLETIISVNPEGHILAHDLMYKFAPCSYTYRSKVSTEILYKKSAASKKSQTVKDLWNAPNSVYRTAESIKRRSVSHLGNKNSLGHKHSEETKRKMSEAQKRRDKSTLKSLSGNNHPNFKTISESQEIAVVGKVFATYMDIKNALKIWEKSRVSKSQMQHWLNIHGLNYIETEEGILVTKT